MIKSHFLPLFIRWRHENADLFTYRCDDTITSSVSFGVSVAVENDTAVVGAYSESEIYGDGYNYGRVYIFKRDQQGQWQQQAKLRNPVPKATGLFGFNVWLSGSTLVIGSLDSPMDAYIFNEENDGTWQYRQTLSQPFSYYGGEVRVAFEGDTLLFLAS